MLKRMCAGLLALVMLLVGCAFAEDTSASLPPTEPDEQELHPHRRQPQLHVEQDASQIENKGLDAFGRNGRNQDIHLLRV